MIFNNKFNKQINPIQIAPISQLWLFCEIIYECFHDKLWYMIKSKFLSDQISLSMKTQVKFDVSTGPQVPCSIW